MYRLDCHWYWPLQSHQAPHSAILDRRLFDKYQYLCDAHMQTISRPSMWDSRRVIAARCDYVNARKSYTMLSHTDSHWPVNRPIDSKRCPLWWNYAYTIDSFRFHRLRAASNLTDHSKFPIHHFWMYAMFSLCHPCSHTIAIDPNYSWLDLSAIEKQNPEQINMRVLNSWKRIQFRRNFLQNDRLNWFAILNVTSIQSKWNHRRCAK